MPRAGKGPRRASARRRLPSRIATRLKDVCAVRFPGSAFVRMRPDDGRECVEVEVAERHASFSGYCCKEPECAVCMDKSDVGLPCCKQTFCIACLEEWRAHNQSTCPLCRQPVPLLRRPAADDFEGTARALRGHLLSQFELRLYGGVDPSLNAEVAHLAATLRRLRAAADPETGAAMDRLIAELKLEPHLN